MAQRRRWTWQSDPCTWFIAPPLLFFFIACASRPHDDRQLIDGAVQTDTSRDTLGPDFLNAVEIDQRGPNCGAFTLQYKDVPVYGTVNGPNVEAEVCRHGLSTYFLGPQEPDSRYSQSFMTSINREVHTTSSDLPSYGFLIRTPTNAQVAFLTGWVGATAAEVGVYNSADHCGWLNFEVILPIPTSVSCPTRFAPCDPGCEGYGEMWVCIPAHQTLRYIARPAATCEMNQDWAKGNWSLTLTSVSPYIVRSGYHHHETHGHLTATLINEADPEDHVKLDLSF